MKKTKLLLVTVRSPASTTWFFFFFLNWRILCFPTIHMSTLAILLAILVVGCSLLCEVKAISRFLQNVYIVFSSIRAARTLHLMLPFYSMLTRAAFFSGLKYLCGPFDTTLHNTPEHISSLDVWMVSLCTLISFLSQQT